jgi:hypothetical protein
MTKSPLNIIPRYTLIYFVSTDLKVITFSVLDCIETNERAED